MIPYGAAVLCFYETFGNPNISMPFGFLAMIELKFLFDFLFS
jgi:hypothetical protein